MRIKSLGFRTDVALRALEGAEVIDRGNHLVVRSPDNPGFWWGNFLLLDALPGPGTAAAWLARFAAEFPAAEHIALGVDGPGEDVAVPAEFGATGLAVQQETVLTCAAVRPPPQPNSAAGIRRLESEADWQQSLDLGVRCYGDDASAEYMIRRTAARARLTRAGHGAWFGAFTGGRLMAQLGVCDAGSGYRPLPARRDRPGGPSPGAGRHARLARGPLRTRRSRREHPGHRGRPGRRGHPGLPGLRLHRFRAPAQPRGAARPRPPGISLFSVTTAETSSAGVTSNA